MLPSFCLLRTSLQPVNFQPNRLASEKTGQAKLGNESKNFQPQPQFLVVPRPVPAAPPEICCAHATGSLPTHVTQKNVPGPIDRFD